MLRFAFHAEQSRVSPREAAARDISLSTGSTFLVIRVTHTAPPSKPAEQMSVSTEQAMKRRHAPAFTSAKHWGSELVSGSVSTFACEAKQQRFASQQDLDSLVEVD